MIADALSVEVLPAVGKDKRLRCYSDPELLALARAGDQEAAHCLINRFLPVIRKVASRLTPHPTDALDLASDIYLRIFEVINTCRDLRTVPAWINRIGLNLYICQSRKKRLVRSVSLELLMEVAGDRFAPVDDSDPAEALMGAFVEQERVQRIRAAVGSLSHPYRDLIEKYYLHRQSYQEIARCTGLSLGTVKSRMFRAREALQRKLGDLIA